MFELNKKHWLIIFGAVVIASFLINLSVTLTTPIVFGDEGFYASRSLWIWENKQIPNYYHIQSQSDAFKVHFIRPPYMMTLLANIFGIGGEFLVKTFLPIVNVMTSILIFLFVKKLYSLEAGVLSSIFLIVIPSLITYTILLYVEAVAVFLITACVYFLYKSLSENRKRFLVISGVCAGVAALTDVGGFLLPIIYLAILFIHKTNYFSFLKKFAILAAIFIIIVAPWYFFHNYLQANTFGIPVIDRFTKGSSIVVLKNMPDTSSITDSFKGLGSGGTNDSILKMGIMNYIEFAYTPIVIFMASIGLFLIFLNKTKRGALVIVWLLILFSINFYLTNSSRGEDAARALLATSVPLSILAGMSAEKIYSGIKNLHKAGKYIAVGFAIFIIIWSLYAANTKAQSLKPIKQFSNSFFNACDWIKQNTEEGSLLVTLWQHRAEYSCKRDTVWISDPGIDKAVLARDNRTINIFKAHGADYVFIQKFSITPENEGESYPLGFVNYISNSPDYRLVYETDKNCLNSGSADCSVVYKILYNS